MTDLDGRKVEVREKKTITVSDPELDRINKNFASSIEEIKVKQKKIKEKSKLTEEDNFILRTQIVFLESAFDYYIHEIITYGIIKIYNGEWETNDQFEGILVKLSTCIDMIKRPELSVETLKDYIIEFFGGLTFLDKKNLNPKLRIIGISSEDISSIVYPNVTQEESKQNFAQFIIDLYRRRNRIVHQCDMEFGKNTKCDINVVEVDTFISTIVKIVEAIRTLIDNKGKNNK